MGERKVLNKYIPADFDPRLVPKGKKPKDDLIPVRMMLPFSIQCSTCSSFMYRGRKFNSKKEPVRGSNGKYLGIQRYRFYIKCTACSQPITFLTDPKNTDYEMESGATRNYEVHKDREKSNADMESEKVTEEKEDPMKALENRVLASQREMADLDNLDEIKAMNMRGLKMMSNLQSQGAGGVTAVIEARYGKTKDVADIELDEEDEALIGSIQFGRNPAEANDNEKIHRLGKEEEDEFSKKRQKEQEMLEKQQMDMLAKEKLTTSSSARLPLIKARRKRKPNNVSEQSKITKQRMDPDHSKEETNRDEDSEDNEGALDLLGGYGSSDSNSS